MLLSNVKRIEEERRGDGRHPIRRGTLASAGPLYPTFHSPLADFRLEA